MLALFTQRYKGAADGYCRLAALESAQVALVLIDLPMDVNADNCRGFTDVRYLDINGDGKLDIVTSMSVKSNSFYGCVNQQVVYLSNSHNPGLVLLFARCQQKPRSCRHGIRDQGTASVGPRAQTVGDRTI